MCRYDYTDALRTIEDIDVNYFIENDKVLLLVTHDKCKLGKPLIASLGRVEKQYPEFFMGRYNLSTNVEFAIKYEIAATPTLLFFKHGKVFDRVTGFLSEEELLELLHSWRN